MTTWLTLIPLVPALAALAILVAGRRLPRGGGWLAVGSLFLSGLGLAVLAGSGVLRGGTLTVEVTWMAVGSLKLTMGFWLDGLSWWMAVLVGVICLLVTTYAVPYMKDEEEGQARFFALMAFFAASMLALVLSGSFVLTFVAWEGVGVASYGLIGFWYRKDEARRAAPKAFLMTRLGDFGFLLGWLLVLHHTGTTHIETFLQAVEGGGVGTPMLTLIALLLFAAAVGKSAQLPLTAWLPDAMVGPTPVSALLHSATMVAAGIYLILRVFPLFERAPYALDVVLWIGAVTALAAALVATAQYDFKRILAWSTVSQLGEMMMALGLAGPVAAAYHLTTHAVFKSALFLVAGAVDHETGSRDLRALGGLGRSMPWTAGVFGVSALALAGFPPFAGFWSEEKILGAAQAHHWGWGLLMLVLVGLAGLYISRAGMAIFGRWPDAPEPESGRPAVLMIVPMLVLGVAALAIGYGVKTPIEHVLPFEPAQHHLGLWRWAAIGGSAFGLAAGAWRVRMAGPVPALGTFPAAIAGALQTAARWPVRGVRRMSRMLPPLEGSLDAGARGVAAGATVAATAANSSESGLDAAARGMGKGTRDAAAGVEGAEEKGFGQGIDRFAHAFRAAGGQLRTLQTGKVFQYTLSLFAYVLAAVVLVAVLLWIR